MFLEFLFIFLNEHINHNIILDTDLARENSIGRVLLFRVYFSKTDECQLLTMSVVLLSAVYRLKVE